MASDSIASVTTGDDQTINVPAHALSEADGKLLRVYRHWLDRRDLIAKMWCPACEVKRSTGMEIGLSPTKVGLICPHGMWFAITPPAPVLVTGHRAPQRRRIINPEVEAIALNDVEAQALRAYASFLQRYGFREALYCLVCDLANQPDGLKAWVRPEGIRFECRHAVRTYRQR